MALSMFICLCEEKSVESVDRRLQRASHEPLVHQELEFFVPHARENQYSYRSGGGIRVVNPGSGLTIASRDRCIAAFHGNLRNYAALATRHCPNLGPGREADLLCYLFDSLGVDLISRLDGRYAFCLYDSKTMRVLAARDPSGAVPLAQGLTRLGNLLIMSSTFMPEGVVDVVHFQPGDFKYGWHAAPRKYGGQQARATHPQRQRILRPIPHSPQLAAQPAASAPAPPAARRDQHHHRHHHHHHDRGAHGRNTPRPALARQRDAGEAARQAQQAPAQQQQQQGRMNNSVCVVQPPRSDPVPKHERARSPESGAAGHSHSDVLLKPNDGVEKPVERLTVPFDRSETNGSARTSIAGSCTRGKGDVRSGICFAAASESDSDMTTPWRHAHLNDKADAVADEQHKPGKAEQGNDRTPPFKGQVQGGEGQDTGRSSDTGGQSVTLAPGALSHTAAASHDAAAGAPDAAMAAGSMSAADVREEAYALAANLHHQVTLHTLQAAAGANSQDTQEPESRSAQPARTTKARSHYVKRSGSCVDLQRAAAMHKSSSVGCLTDLGSMMFAHGLAH